MKFMNFGSFQKIVTAMCIWNVDRCTSWEGLGNATKWPYSCKDLCCWVFYPHYCFLHSHQQQLNIIQTLLLNCTVISLPSISQVDDDKVSIRDFYHTTIEPTLDTTQGPLSWIPEVLKS